MATSTLEGQAANASTADLSGPWRCSFRLISYRQDMAFAFMRQGFTTPVLAAWGPTIHVANPNAPLQPRLALVGSDPSKMQLQWSTRNSSKPTVRCGLGSLVPAAIASQ